MAVQVVERADAVVRPIQQHLRAAMPLPNCAAGAAVRGAKTSTSHKRKWKNVPTSVIAGGGMQAAK